jgi:predicted negative regulator of RcsB-dependent stress response
MTMKKSVLGAVLALSLAATSVDAGEVAPPASSGGGDNDALFVVGVLALMALVGWSASRGGQGNGATTSTRGSVDTQTGNSGPAKGKVLMNF